VTATEETPKARRNRELGELLQEMRVAITGVQVLFAFLLTVPFSQRFPDIGAAQRRIYLAAVLSAALSSLLLIAPAANHRLLFRDGTKEELLRAANRLVIVGLVMLAAGIGLSLYLVTAMVYGSGWAAVAAAGVAAVTAFTWFVFPRLLHEVHRDD
jgi:sterol desaturase/sphingolipid hydroxylase (fatty acid hydroxylase superfamily)